MSEKAFEFQFQMVLTEAEIDRVMAGIREALHIGAPPHMHATKDDPLSDCTEKTKTRSYRKTVREFVTTDPSGHPLPFPVPTPVLVSYTCTVTETTTICPGQDPYTHSEEVCNPD